MSTLSQLLDPTLLGLFFNGVMALGAVLIFWQIRLTKQHAVTTFEDSLNREYREIIHKLPAEALLGGDLEPEELKANLDDFVYYIDLSNEQVFLRMNGRVSKETWKSWRDGMRSNFKKAAFAAAWDIISSKAKGDYAELRKLIADDFRDDPGGWK